MVSSQIKLEILYKEKPHNRHSPGLLRYLKYNQNIYGLTSKPPRIYTINKNLTDIAGAVITMLIFILCYQLSPKLDSFIRQCSNAVFYVLGFNKRITLQLRSLYLRILFVKTYFIMRTERPQKHLQNQMSIFKKILYEQQYHYFLIALQ